MPSVRKYRRYERNMLADAGLVCEEREIELPRLATKVRVLEAGEGKPAVFVPGGPDVGATFAYVAAQTNGIRWCLLDRPGTGLSPALPRPPDATTLPGYAATLCEDVLDGLSLPSATRVGSSFGGYCTLRGAIALGDRVERLVLAGCPAFIPGWKAPGFASLLRIPVVGRVLLRLPATKSAARSGLRDMGHGELLESGRLPGPMEDWTWAWQRYTDTVRNDGAMIRACGTWRGGFDPALDLRPEELAGVVAPTLAIAGTADPVGDDAVVGALAQHIPDLQVEVMQGAGHLPWLDDPARVARVVEAFVAG